MTPNVWMITATRTNGAIQVKPYLSLEIGRALMAVALQNTEIVAAVQAIGLQRCDPHVEYGNTGPVLPLDKALQYRNPPDALTQLLENGR